MTFRVKIDTSEIDKFLLKSPKRTLWAARTALKMTGYKYMQEVQVHIRKGENWPSIKQPKAGYFKNMKPLEALEYMVRYRVGKAKGDLRLRLGFFHMKLGSQSKDRYASYKARFKAKFGMSPMQLARVHEYGRRQRVTKKVRRRMNALGWHLKRATSTLITPMRPMIEGVWRKRKHEIPGFIEQSFYKKWFGKEGPKV